jgi:hypothetical protein
LNSQPDILRKTLRLFLSVDIAGSTAYKSRQPDKVQPWLPALHRNFQSRWLDNTQTAIHQFSGRRWEMKWSSWRKSQIIVR